ncbi:lysophospholipid acyltransferase family protein [Wenzhouxiangella limi]|uniref:1-acyl-sn-glycerol-3-phosphate acyltransferase n=1 Tax=Wenzhouxiangella limi TaxID=2707351 RepID=A0A845V776_9GAMM|nr:lysophospholipid acyltransferase family protein [Wenzhouxiangella limi]NDY96031.1 1-acyl-sn-glycerol-3-phosphate acyltransferase [Wenzhouxiangella limi]
MAEYSAKSRWFGWPLLWRLPLLLVWVMLLPVGLLAFLPGIRELPAGEMKLHMRVHRLWTRGVVAVCGVRLRVSGSLPPPPCLVVANHITWFDIPVLHALWPMGLVAKVEIRSWPLIGRLAEIAGSIFIQRGSQESRRRVNRRMAARLRRGEMIGVFPEGGIHPERGVKRFHARLFGSAIRARVPVVPLAIRYWREGNQHDTVVMGLGDSLFSSGFRLLSQPGLEVQVTIGQPITDWHIGRDALARRTQDIITGFYEA